ncbi:MAG: hypothetical protein SGBAC_012177, partial [Bacillariaceae sp.]
KDTKKGGKEQPRPLAEADTGPPLEDLDDIEAKSSKSGKKDTKKGGKEQPRPLADSDVGPPPDDKKSSKGGPKEEVPILPRDVGPPPDERGPSKSSKGPAKEELLPPPPGRDDFGPAPLLSKAALPGSGRGGSPFSHQGMMPMFAAFAFVTMFSVFYRRGRRKLGQGYRPIPSADETATTTV